MDKSSEKILGRDSLCLEREGLLVDPVLFRICRSLDRILVHLTPSRIFQIFWSIPILSIKFWLVTSVLSWTSIFPISLPFHTIPACDKNNLGVAWNSKLVKVPFWLKGRCIVVGSHEHLVSNVNEIEQHFVIILHTFQYGNLDTVP